MKKIITLCLAFVMLMSIGITASARYGGFVNSTFNNLAPVLVEGKNIDDDCDAELIITPYAERETLPEFNLEKIEELYDILKNTEDLGAVNEELADMAKEMGLDPKGLAVSDIFDIRMEGCDDHDLHGHFDVTLKADALKYFVCLLHYHGDSWHIVEGAEVTHEGTHLEFDAMEFSPFAIVVDAVALEAEADEGVSLPDVTTPADTDAAGTGDHFLCWLIIIILLVLIVVIILSKKSKKEKK